MNFSAIEGIGNDMNNKMEFEKEENVINLSSHEKHSINDNEQTDYIKYGEKTTMNIGEIMPGLMTKNNKMHFDQITFNGMYKGVSILTTVVHNLMMDFQRQNITLMEANESISLLTNWVKRIIYCLKKFVGL